MKSRLSKLLDIDVNDCSHFNFLKEGFLKMCPWLLIFDEIVWR